MSATARRIRAGIAVTAVSVIGILALLKFAGIDQKLFRILAFAGVLLVTSLFVTYRALHNLVEAFRANPNLPSAPPHDEDEQ